jgi:hypothetical protein
MIKIDQKPFTKRYVSSKVTYIIDPKDYKIEHVNIIKYEKVKFKSTEIYINLMINYIKDNIIKNCKNLKLVKIFIDAFDNKNIIHRFMVNVSNIIKDFLKLNGEFNFSKTIFIFIMDGNKLLFSGILDFSHLFY